jgi:biotin transport system substrate-specific component
MFSSFAITLTRRLNLRSQLLADAILIVTGSLIVAMMAQVRIALPFTPVPVTGQTFAVLLVGAALGAHRGAASLGLYLLEGALGLPFFAGATSGIAILSGPTGGYLFGFIFAAGLVGWLADRALERRLWSAIPVFLAGQGLIYIFGVLGLARFMGLVGAFNAGVVPFVVGDILKVLLVAIALPVVWKFIK